MPEDSLAATYFHPFDASGRQHMDQGLNQGHDDLEAEIEAGRVIAES